MPRSLFAPPLIPVAPDFECHHHHTSAEPANCVASQESDKPSSRTSSPEPVIEQIIAILGPWMFVFVLILVAAFIISRRDRACSTIDTAPSKPARPSGRPVLPVPRATPALPIRNGLGAPRSFSYQELSEATGGFDLRNKLGAGGFGSVYRGVLPGTGTVVAIKTMDEGSDQGVKEFLAEVRTISRVRHRNVVQLLGWCGREHHFMLVYEYMPNGSLDKALFRRPTCRLSWRQRFKIIFGIAAALDHLHEGWRHKVIHRDVKSSNIMLDAHFCAKLGDFGLARMNPHQMSLATTNPAGTFGYLAPESAIFGKFTVKSDVFAFGAVVLEIACGRGALEPLLPNEQSVLKDWVDKAFKEGQLMRVADPRLQGQFNFGQMQAVLLLGLVCSASNPNDRPSMRQVLQVLAGETPMLPVSVCKPAKGREERRAPSSVAGPLTICSTPCT